MHPKAAEIPFNSRNKWQASIHTKMHRVSSPSKQKLQGLTDLKKETLNKSDGGGTGEADGEGRERNDDKVPLMGPNRTKGNDRLESNEDLSTKAWPEGGKFVTFLKGAPETVMAMCSRYIDEVRILSRGKGKEKCNGLAKFKSVRDHRLRKEEYESLS